MLKNQYGLLIALLVLFGAVASIFVIGDVRRSGTTVERREPSTLGESLYIVNCSGCHSQDGSGKLDLMGAPALNSTGRAWSLSNTDIETIILEGGEVMPAFRDRLSLQDTAQIIQHIQSWWTPEQVESQSRLNIENPSPTE